MESLLVYNFYVYEYACCLGNVYSNDFNNNNKTI